MRNGMPQRREWESGAGLEFIQFGLLIINSFFQLHIYNVH